MPAPIKNLTEETDTEATDDDDELEDCLPDFTLDDLEWEEEYPDLCDDDAGGEEWE